MRKKRLPAWVLSDEDAPRSMRPSGERSFHGLGEQGGEVFGVGRVFDRDFSQSRAAPLLDDHAEVVRVVLHHRLWKRPEVGLPCVVLLPQALEAALDEGRPLAEREGLLLSGHGHVLLGYFNPNSAATAATPS